MVAAELLLLLLYGLFVCLDIGSFYDGGFAALAESALIAIWLELLLRHVNKKFFIFLLLIRDRLILLFAADCVSLPLYGNRSFLRDMLLELNQGVGPLLQWSRMGLRRRSLCFD